MNIIQSVKDKPLLPTVAAVFVSITAVITGTQAIGIKLIPWASAGDIEKIEKAGENRDIEMLKLIRQMQAEQKEMSADQAELMRDFWTKKLDEADEELRGNPASRTAKKQRHDAIECLAKLDRREAESPHP